MSSENKILSRDEMQFKIQEDIISAIKKKVDDSSRIRFWEPHERLYTDDELNEMYYAIYNIFVTFKKGSKDASIVIGKDFTPCKNPIYTKTFLRLDSEVIIYLKGWAHKAIEAINKYLDRDAYTLVKVRFDLLPYPGGFNFEIPNLPLENIIFRGKHGIISKDDYIDEKIRDNSQFDDDDSAVDTFRNKL